MNTKTDKLFYLEGIRGVAAFIVLVAHLKNIFDYDFQTHTLLYFTDLTHSSFLGRLINSFIVVVLDGKLAVQIFWFMSGYVISIKLFGRNGQNYLKTAFLKRYFRLAIPVLGSVLLAYGLLKMGLMYNLELAQVLGKRSPILANFYNFEPDLLIALRSGLWDAFFDFNDQDLYNTNLWTMAPELFGSFFCFILFAVFKTRQYRYFFYLGFILIAIFLEYHWLVTFILGYMLCDIDHTSNRLKKILDFISKNIFSKWYYCIAVLLLIIIINGFWLRFYSAYAKIFVSAVFVWMVMNSGSLREFFSQKILVWLGKISFSLYLLHFPILYSLSCYLYIILGLPHVYSAWISSLISILFILGAAVLYTRFIDTPATRFSGKIARALMKPLNL